MTAITERLSAALAGRYRIERHVGEGGMASVYLAEDMKHDRKVAVKVLKPELAAVLGAERFVVEIKTTASLQHPHILPLFDSGTADGFLFYVMPFIKGETLRDKLNRETQLGVDDAVRIAREVADALDYAHRNGVIHRDIKPENILLHDGRPMVADFGIALALSAAAGGRMTETGLSLGTPHYMSPEQATAEKEISARSDVYSLASVLYEMLAGEPPHLGGSAQQIIMKIITDRARPLTDLRKSVPPHVAAAVAKALEKLPADRFETAKAFADALGNPAFTVSGTVTHASTRSASRKPVIMLAAAVLGLATLAGGWAIGRKTTPVPEAQPVQFVIELPDSVTSVNRCCGPAQVLSPNGITLVFVGMKGSTGALYRRELHHLEATLIPGTEEATSPSFSPNGDWLMFEQGGQLKKAPMNGGPIARIAATGQVQGATWADNDTIVYSNAETLQLWKVAASGGTSQRVPVVDTLARYLYPSALPGSRYVLVSIRRSLASLEESRIGVIDVTTGDVDSLVVGARALYANGSLFFGTADNSLLLQPVDLAKRTLGGQAVVLLTDVAINGGTNPDFSVSPTGWLAYEILRGGDVEQLRIVGGQTSSVLKLPGRATGDVEDPAISPDGSRVMLRIQGANATGDLWMFDSRQATVTRFTVSGARNAAWSRDGKRVAYSKLSSDSSPPGIYVQSVEENQVPELVLRGNNLFPGSWTLDGRSILFNAYVTGSSSAGYDIGLITVGDTAPQWIVKTQFSERQPQLSPDGRIVAYTSNRSGPFEVYVQLLGSAGAAVQVSDAGGHSPRWSRDGKTLFYFNQATIVAASLTGGPALTVASRRVVSSGISTDNNGMNSNWDVFPDGKLLVIDQGGVDAGRRVALIQNWPALARSLGAKR